LTFHKYTNTLGSIKFVQSLKLLKSFAAGNKKGRAPLPGLSPKKQQLKTTTNINCLSRTIL